MRGGPPRLLRRSAPHELNVARSTSVNTGEVSERFKVPDSKSGVRKYRGFESSSPLYDVASADAAHPAAAHEPLMTAGVHDAAGRAGRRRRERADPGEVAEGFKAHAWNACFESERGFESHPLRSRDGNRRDSVMPVSRRTTVNPARPGREQRYRYDGGGPGTLYRRPDRHGTQRMGTATLGPPRAGC